LLAVLCSASQYVSPEISPEAASALYIGC